MGAWIEASIQSPDDVNESPYNSCYLKDVEWDEEWWLGTGQGEKLATWLQMSDRINSVLLQIDNTLLCGEDGDPGWGVQASNAILERLVRYNLIFLDIPASPCRTPYLFKYATSVLDRCPLSPGDLMGEVIRIALIQRRWDVVAAFDLGKEPPPSRREYWQQTYGDLLGTKNVDYWEWSRNPESLEICEELTRLLTHRPTPSWEVKATLQALSYNKNPFEKPAGLDPLLHFGKLPKFYSMSEGSRGKRRNEFRQWHSSLVDALGRDQVERIYKTCYTCDWSVVEEVLACSGDWWEVLGVDPEADYLVVKKAWKDLAKVHHPDLKTGNAQQMKKINDAWDVFEKQHVEKVPPIYQAYRVNL